MNNLYLLQQRFLHQLLFLPHPHQEARGLHLQVLVEDPRGVENQTSNEMKELLVCQATMTWFTGSRCACLHVDAMEKFVITL